MNIPEKRHDFCGVLLALVMEPGHHFKRMECKGADGESLLLTHVDSVTDGAHALVICLFVV